MSVTTYEMTAPKFLLLTPGTHLARKGRNFGAIYKDCTSPLMIQTVLDGASASRILSMDWETQGADYSQDIRIVGLGLAWDTGNCYIDWASCSPEVHNALYDLLYEHKGLIAHNVYFDGGVLRKHGGLPASWHACTYALLAMLHNESIEARWGLKQAQVELLGWADSNEVELDEWLITHGWYLGVKRKDESSFHLIEEYRNGKIKPDKGEMWRAPPQVLGRYCALDAESCYLLYTEILEPVFLQFPGMVDWFHKDFMHLVKQLIEQKIAGMLVDKEGLIKYREELIADIRLIEEDFRSCPGVPEAIEKIENTLRSEGISKEPQKHNKGGKVSKNWVKWCNKKAAILRGEDKSLNFNMNSNDQMRKLLYEHLGMPVHIMTGDGDSHNDSKKPQPATSTKALAKMGTVGSILIERSDRIKALSFVDAYIDLLRNRPTMHPSFRTPGTITGRLSGKEPNWQQMPKTYSLMQNFIPRPGHVLIDLDFCLHPDTEYLTPAGWVTIENLKKGMQVWQVNPETRIGSWVVPSRIIRKEYTGKMYNFSTKRGTLKVTENHRMFWINQTTRNRPPKYIINLSQEGVPNSYTATLSVSSQSKAGGYIPRALEMDTACMLQADAHLHNGVYDIQVSLPRKRERVGDLLGRNGKEYPIREGHTLPVEHWWNIEFESPLLRGKTLFLEDLDTSLADQLVECLGFWDGSVLPNGGITYSSSDYSTVDQVQRYLVRSGYECRVSSYQPNYPGSKLSYRCTIRKAKGIRLRKGIDDGKFEEYSGLVGCVTVPDGLILVRYGGQTFVTGNCSLEPTVTTELSQDKNMEMIYGNTASPYQDFYLFVAASIPGIGDRVRAAGYDPLNPTKEGTARAKKDCKQDRSTVKVACLAMAYGASVNKIVQILEEQNIFMEYHEVEAIHSGYWNLFAKVKDYARSLYFEWKRNKGFIVNGMGRPMACSEKYNRDIMNRGVQSLGHDVLVKYIRILCEELERQEIPYTPILIDLHDSTCVEVPEEFEKKAVDVFHKSIDLLNEELGGRIKLRGTAEAGKNLAIVKGAE